MHYPPSLPQSLTPLFLQHIQVLVFDPQSLIGQLGKMDTLVTKEKGQPKKQADAFRQWLSARKHFGAGAAVGAGVLGPGRRRSAPATAVESVKAVEGSRETERARELLGQVVASQNKTEQLQEEGKHTYIVCVHMVYVCGCVQQLQEVRTVGKHIFTYIHVHVRTCTYIHIIRTYVHTYVHMVYVYVCVCSNLGQLHVYSIHVE